MRGCIRDHKHGCSIEGWYFYPHYFIHHPAEYKPAVKKVPWVPIGKED